MGLLTLLGITDCSRLIPTKQIDCIDKVPKNFQMLYREHFDPRSVFTATLYFSPLHDKIHAYTVRKFDASVRWIDNDSDERSQSFLPGRHEPFYTLKEAYNLLQGRFVLKRHYLKDGTWLSAWAQLDFERKYFSGNYATTLFKAGKSYDVLPELWREFYDHRIDAARLDDLATALEMGNREVLSISRGCSTELAYVQANPKDRKIDIIRLPDNNLPT